MVDKDDKQRINDLEAEVASLRAKLGDDAEASAPEQKRDEAESDGAESVGAESVGAESGGAERGGAEDLAPGPSKVKVILLSTIVVLVGLAMIFGVFSVLSKGFDKFAPKAAERFIPKGAKKALPPPTTKLAPTPPAADAGEPKERVLVPGL